MYRCRHCDQCVGPNQPMQKHTVYRADGSIAAELPVCEPCKELLHVEPPPRKVKPRLPQPKPKPKPRPLVEPMPNGPLGGRYRRYS